MPPYMQRPMCLCVGMSKSMALGSISNTWCGNFSFAWKNTSSSFRIMGTQEKQHWNIETCCMRYNSKSTAETKNSWEISKALLASNWRQIYRHLLHETSIDIWIWIPGQSRTSHINRNQDTTYQFSTVSWKCQHRLMAYRLLESVWKSTFSSWHFKLKRRGAGYVSRTAELREIRLFKQQFVWSLPQNIAVPSTHEGTHYSS